MARPRTDLVRSHDAATCCRASHSACKPRRRARKVAEMAVWGVFFEHLYTSVNGVGKHDINPGAPGWFVVWNPPSSLVPFPPVYGAMTSVKSRHPRSTDSFLFSV